MSGGNASPSCCRLHRCDRLSLHSLGAANVNSEVRLDWMSALGQKPTYASQQVMSALPPIATAKADFRTTSCLLYSQKRTCAVQLEMSALGQKRTFVCAVRTRYWLGRARAIALRSLRRGTPMVPSSDPRSGLGARLLRGATLRVRFLVLGVGGHELAREHALHVIDIDVWVDRALREDLRRREHDAVPAFARVAAHLAQLECGRSDERNEHARSKVGRVDSKHREVIGLPPVV